MRANSFKNFWESKNINVDIINFLDIDVVTKKNIVLNKRFLLNHYYDLNFLSGKNTDTIQTSTAIFNHNNFVNFQHCLEDELKKKFQFVESNLRTFVKIQFLNFRNEKKNEYYEVKFLVGEILNDTIKPSNYFNRDSRENIDMPQINLTKAEKINYNEIISKIN